MKFYIATVIKTEIHINAMGRDITLPFKDAGFYGMAPVFATKKEAIDFADGNPNVQVLEMVEVK